MRFLLRPVAWVNSLSLLAAAGYMLAIVFPPGGIAAALALFYRESDEGMGVLAAALVGAAVWAVILAA